MSGESIERSGRFSVDTDYGDAFDTLADPVAIASCLPDDVGTIEPLGGDRAAVDVAVGVGAIRPRLSLTLVRRTADRDGGVIEYTADGEGSRSHVHAAGRFALESADDGVVVDWTGEAEFGGLLASLGANVGRLETVAADKIEAVTTNIRDLL